MIIIIRNSTNEAFAYFQIELAIAKFKELIQDFKIEREDINWQDIKTEKDLTDLCLLCHLNVDPVFTFDYNIYDIPFLDDEDFQEKLYAKFQAVAAISYAAGMLLKKTESKDNDITKLIQWGSEFEEQNPAENFKSKPADVYYAELGKFFDSKVSYFDKKE